MHVFYLALARVCNIHIPFNFRLPLISADFRHFNPPPGLKSHISPLWFSPLSNWQTFQCNIFKGFLATIYLAYTLEVILWQIITPKLSIVLKLNQKWEKSLEKNRQDGRGGIIHIRYIVNKITSYWYFGEILCRFCLGFRYPTKFHSKHICPHPLPP